MDGETRVSGEAVGMDLKRMLRTQLKLANRRTGIIRRHRMSNSPARSFPIVSATGLFLSDRRVTPDRRAKSVEGFRRL
jgi:hypothetical protein